MTTDSFTAIKKLISGISSIPESSVTEETTTAELKLDSLDYTELILDIEEEFDIFVENEDSFSSVGDIVNYVNVQLAC